jgi:hypothetical protein
MKRRTFLRGVVILGTAAARPVRWAYAALRKTVKPPLIARQGVVFAPVLSVVSGWPSYAEAY